MHLDLTRNLPDPEGFCEHLVSNQRCMSGEEANRMNARLILILAHQIGDTTILKAAIDFDAGPEGYETKPA